MKKINLYLLMLICLLLTACASLSTKADTHFSESSIEKIPFNTSRESLEKMIGKASSVAEHEDGTVLYYDTPQAGHYTFPIAKFAFNKKNQLIGKTWYCDKNCDFEDREKLNKRYPAASFVVSVPKVGRKLNYGPNERLYTDSSRNMNIEADGQSITVIHWDLPGSVFYLNR
ncbi:MAG: hypothetical protein AABZ31_10210 [Bdellovibrionota bacterium]